MLNVVYIDVRGSGKKTPGVHEDEKGGGGGKIK